VLHVTTGAPIDCCCREKQKKRKSNGRKREMHMSLCEWCASAGKSSGNPSTVADVT